MQFYCKGLLSTCHLSSRGFISFVKISFMKKIITLLLVGSAFASFADSWVQKASYAGGSRYYAIGFSIGGKGYMGTGFYPSFKRDFWQYDPLTNVWSQKAD